QATIENGDRRCVHGAQRWLHPIWENHNLDRVQWLIQLANTGVEFPCRFPGWHTPGWWAFFVKPIFPLAVSLLARVLTISTREMRRVRLLMQIVESALESRSFIGFIIQTEATGFDIYCVIVHCSRGTFA